MWNILEGLSKCNERFHAGGHDIEADALFRILPHSSLYSKFLTHKLFAIEQLVWHSNTIAIPICKSETYITSFKNIFSTYFSDNLINNVNKSYCHQFSNNSVEVRRLWGCVLSWKMPPYFVDSADNPAVEIMV